MIKRAEHERFRMHLETTRRDFVHDLRSSQMRLALGDTQHLVGDHAKARRLQLGHRQEASGRDGTPLVELPTLR